MAAIPSFMYECLDGSTVTPTPQNNLHITQNAIGLPQYRPKQSSRITRYSGLTYILDTTQFASFRSWVEVGLRSGSLPFTMVDPVDGVVREYKLVNGIYRPKNIGRRTWQITIDLDYSS